MLDGHLSAMTIPREFTQIKADGSPGASAGNVGESRLSRSIIAYRAIELWREYDSVQECLIRSKEESVCCGDRQSAWSGKDSVARKSRAVGCVIRKRFC